MAIVEELARGTDGRRRLGLKSPATLEPVGEISVATAADVQSALARARAAQPAWGATPVAERARIVRSGLDVLLRRKPELVEILVRESGKTRIEAVAMELVACCDFLNYWSARAPDDLADEWRKLHGYMRPLKKLLVTYRPLGVVGIITPWNGPLALSLNPTVQALLAGNAVLLKPSEISPRSGAAAADILLEAGVPKDVLQILDGDGETGAALVDAGVDKISFTGSVRVGRKVGEACGRNLIPCTLELGGKDPMIGCADADLERAAGGALFGGFFNAGQVCCSTERVYVVEAVADEFTRRVVEKVKPLRLGEDLGPMIWPAQLDIIEKHVADAVARGAKVLVGGKRRGPYFEPTVLTDVTHDMLIMREETFGPILPIARVRDEEEALRLANDSTFGLAATVWTKDDAKAVRLAKRLNAGSVCVNDTAITYGALEAPFGGRKASGVGTVHGENALRAFCHEQPILIDRFGLKEEQVWYPYTADKGKLLQKIMKWMWGTPLGRLLS